MNRYLATILALLTVLTLSISTVMAQSDKDGWAIYDQAEKLRIEAKSKDDLMKAQDKFEQASRIFQRTNSDKGTAYSWNQMGLINKSQGEYAKALEYYDKSLAILRQLGDVKGEGTCLSNIGAIYDSWGQYAKALEYYEKSLQITRKIGNTKQEGLTLNNIGLVYQWWGQYSKALENYEKSLAIDRKIGNLNGEGISLNNIGLVYESWGQYAKALEYYEKALPIFKKIGDLKTESITLNNIGEVYRSWGQYAKALECDEKSLSIDRKIGNLKGEGISLNNIGLVYMSWGQYTKALEFYEKGLAIFRKIEDVETEGITLSNIAHLNMAMGKHDQALANLRKTLDIYTRIKVPTDGVKNSIGEVYLEMGDIASAEPFIKESGYNSSLGGLALLKSDYDGAKKYYEKLLIKAEQNRNADNLFTAYTGLGKVYESLEDYKKAEEYYEKGIIFTEEIRSSLLPSERKEFFSVKINGFLRSEPGKGLTRVQMKLNQASGSIDSSEVTRARAFADNLFQTSTSGPSGVPREVLEKEDMLVTHVAALKKELAKTDREKNQARYEVLTLQVKEAEVDLRSFVEMLWEKHRAYAAVKYPRPVPLKNSALHSDEYVIMFDCFEDGVGVKVVKGKEIVETHYSKFKQSELEKDIRKFREPFETVKFRDFDPTLAHKIYKRLLAPVMAEVPEGSPIIIIPDGVLALLPFEALIVRGNATWKQGKIADYPDGVTYLGDLYPISYYQSITALTLVREATRTKKPGENLLIIADPVFDMKDNRAQAASNTKVAEKDKGYYPGLMSAIEEGCTGFKFCRLPGTGLLAENLKKLYGQKCDDPYVGLKADKTIFLNTLAPKMESYGQIVFATHGLFSDKIPGLMEPFLALSMVPSGTDGFLRMSDVMSLSINADLVALTACQTGLGRDLSGEGVMSMGRAFQYAGARSVLMSLWSVAEKSSIMLVEDFFKYRKAGKSKLESLKLARNDIRKEGFEHPFFWAPFILVGEVN